MGLTNDLFEFPGAPPTRAELEAALRSNGAEPNSIDTYQVEGNRVVLSCMLDQVTISYAKAFLEGRGGQQVPPRTAPLPAFVARPLQSYSWWQRLRIRFLLRP